jgi:hypothetical protein
VRVEVIPQPPRRPDRPAFDPANGVLLAPAEDVERLVAGGSAELEAAGAVVGGRPHPALRPALAAIEAPRRVLVIQGDRGDGRAWIGEEAAALALPAGDGRLALVTVDPARAHATLAALCGLDAAWPAPHAGTLRLAIDALARHLVARAVPGIPDPVTRHWRVVDAATATAVEVVIAGTGTWLVVPDGEEVELRPASGAEVLHHLQND